MKKVLLGTILLFTILFGFNIEANAKVKTNENFHSYLVIAASKNKKVDCDDFFGKDTLVGKMLRDIYSILRFAVPIILLALSIIDFGKAIVGQDAKDIKKATSRFGIRLIIAILILVLPTILNFFLGLFGITCTL